MKIGIIGTGNMGRTLGARWVRGGHAVLFGSRDRGKAQAVAASVPGSVQGTKNGQNASQATFAEAATMGEVVFNCTHGGLRWPPFSWPGRRTSMARC